MADSIERYKRLESDKSTYTAIWDDINRFIFPNSETFDRQYGGGQKRRNVQFDGTAERALEIFAASTIGLIANPAVKYINFEPRNKDLLTDRATQEFIEEAQGKVLSVFNDPGAKFYDNLFYAMQYLGAYGTTAFLIDQDDDTVATFRAEGPKGLNFTESFNGKVEEVFIEREYTAAQLRSLAERKEWSLPDQFERKKDDDKCKIVRHIYRNPDYKANSLNLKNALYKSEHWFKDEKHLAKESGFQTFPAPVGRWGKLDSEKWGDSPGRIALTDVKVLNASERHLTYAEEYSLRPALVVSSEAKFGKLNLSPGGVLSGRGNPNDTIRQLAINGDLNFSLERNRLRREVVMQAFYVDIFQTMSNVDMTATEAQIRQQERLRGLAPKVARIQSDILGPAAERVLYMLIERGDLIPPQSLRGQKLEVVYTSPIANAQRAQEAINLQLFLQDMGMIAGANPDALIRLDFDAIVEEFAEIRGVPAKVLLEEKEYQAIMQAREQQQQLQQGLAVAEQAGNAGAALQQLGNEQSQ